MVQSKYIQNHTSCLSVKWSFVLDTHSYKRVSACVILSQDVHMYVGCWLGVMIRICAWHPPMSEQHPGSL